MRRQPPDAGNQAPRGLLHYVGRLWPCRLGRGGLSARKREGDGATPTGCFALLSVLYRADRLARPRSGLPISPIGRRDGWCDAPADRNYNRPVTLPYPASAETLWRDDNLYDLLVVIGHNTCPRARGLGSAVFLHLPAPEQTPTEGCLAMSERDLRWLIANARPGDRIEAMP